MDSDRAGVFGFAGFAGFSVAVGPAAWVERELFGVRPRTMPMNSSIIFSSREIRVRGRTTSGKCWK